MSDTTDQDQQTEINQADPVLPGAAALPVTPNPFDELVAETTDIVPEAPTLPEPPVVASPAVEEMPAVSPGIPQENTADHDNLLSIKQEALQHLGPLVGHLVQSPEEKFRTTMMMIQASDDHSLISSAYETAQAIPDEKARAQAFLDIINEINYFTQHSHQQQ